MTLFHLQTVRRITARTDAALIAVMAQNALRQLKERYNFLLRMNICLGYTAI